MDGLSLKEKAIAAFAVLALLYLAAVGLWFFRQEGEWTKARRAHAKAVKKYEDECALIAQKAKWNDAYQGAKSAMPVFGADKITDTTWLEVMDRIAASNCLQIASRQVGAEVVAGDVLEVPIDVRKWEGSFESLVRFMYEAENTELGMFDITAISFKPLTNKKGYFSGAFTLSCAFMRE